jgi:hypothetical protein
LVISVGKRLVCRNLTEDGLLKFSIESWLIFVSAETKVICTLLLSIFQQILLLCVILCQRWWCILGLCLISGILTGLTILNAISIDEAHLRKHDGVLIWHDSQFKILGSKWILEFLVINLGGFLILILSGTSRLLDVLWLILHKNFLR